MDHCADCETGAKMGACVVKDTSAVEPASCWLVRHGERIDETDQYFAWASTTHPSRRFDPPLTAAGKAQADVAAQALAAMERKYAALYCSPQLRCLETALPIAKALDMKIVIVAGLSQCAKHVEERGLHRVLDYFVHRLPPEERDRMLPQVADMEADNTIESFEACFHRLGALHPSQHIVLVTHREGIRLLGQREGAKGRWHTPYCCITQFHYHSDGTFKSQFAPADPHKVFHHASTGWRGGPL